MKVENLTLTNFNNRKFNIHTYTLENNPNLAEKKRPLMIVIPRVLIIYHKEKVSQWH